MATPERMRRLRVALAVCAALFASTLTAKTVVFWQPGFPTVESAPISRQALEQAIGTADTTFANLDTLTKPASLDDADLLVLPYGSAFPAGAFANIMAYLRQGGNLLVLGGRPFRVPVTQANGQVTPALPTDAYEREIGIVHTYEVPQKDERAFAWGRHLFFLDPAKIEARKYFVLQGRIDGLGYMLNSDSDRVAAPVVATDHTSVRDGGMLGARFVFLDFEPAPGYWDSADGISLIRTAARYAKQGIAQFSIETEFPTLKLGETPQLVVHVRDIHGPHHRAENGAATIQLMAADRVIEEQQVSCPQGEADAELHFNEHLSPGFYHVNGIYREAGQIRSAYQNGFWVVEDDRELNSGPTLGVKGDFLTEDGKPFFPFGTNYFTTEDPGWDFSSPRNAAVWEHDFEEMARHGVSFVRTGVWGLQFKFLGEPYGGASERFLRNVEAFLLCARRHNIAVNFTFFAFDPQTILRLHQNDPVVMLPGGNPYLDPITIRAEQDYMLSIVERFKNVPFLSWDLINEPSFSNPHHLWTGNTPNGDPAELQAWYKWLGEKYGTIEKLASAWSVTPEQLNSFDAVPLPEAHDLRFDLENGNAGQARAVDYNLFAQEMFANWVHSMVAAIRLTGSRQLIDIGQDEGGITNRVLNQFYAGAGLSFTTNHTYRQNQALLWDSLAAKVPGIPNIVGETGYQPIILPNGQWQFDEISGFGLQERKWAYGFAGGTSGTLPWDWAREIYFGIERSDGSNKIWVNMLRDMGAFAHEAALHATALIQPQVAIVIPQSLQLSTLGSLSIEAQQTSVRALYGYARSQAYMVGEDQIASLGNPKLIIVPSPWIFSQRSWDALIEKVKAGATLLISGPFDAGPHFEPTGRQDEIGIPYHSGLLSIRDNQIKWPNGELHLIYGDEKTNFLERAYLDNGDAFVEKSIGRGRILFLALPLELNENLEAVGDVYKYALQKAGVGTVYSANLDPGILISPTQFPHATLYVIASESTRRTIMFHDERSGKDFSGQLAPGRAALLLIGEKGNTLASYNWNR